MLNKSKVKVKSQEVLMPAEYAIKEIVELPQNSPCVGQRGLI